MKNNIFLNKNLLRLIDFFKSRNQQLFLVGGAVRDIIMNSISSDIDLATSATPDQMLCWEELDKEIPAKVIDTGSKFGTVTFVFPNKEAFEITTFRKDITNGRHPKVEFSNSIVLDLSRRDLTINAIAIDLINNNNNEIKIIDPFEGLKDIQNGVIKFVGNQLNRIIEDPLRMLRALRFTARFNFKLDEDAKKFISTNFNLISNISNERIISEFKKAAGFDRFDRFVELVRETNLFNVIDNVFNIMNKTKQNKFHKWNVFRHTTMALHVSETINKCELSDIINDFRNKNIFKGIIPNDINVKFALLLHDIGKPSCKTIDDNDNIRFLGHEKASAELTKIFLKKFKCSKEFIGRISFIVENHMKFKEENLKILKRSILRFLRRNDLDIFNNNEHMQLFLELVFVINADCNSLGTEFEIKDVGINILNLIVEIFNSGKNETNLINIDNIALNGNDIIDILNIKPGPEVGIVKKFILEKIIDNPELNNFKDLSKIVKEFKF